MKLTVFGASGGIGRLLLEQATAAGHDVTAVVRDPAKVAGHPGRVVSADLLTAAPAVLAGAVSGADAVVSAVGPASNATAGVASQGTTKIIRAMREAGVRRLVVVSAAPVGTIAAPGRPHPPRRDPGDRFFLGAVLYPILKAALRPQYRDLALMEDALRDSGLDWTAVRPVQLTDKPPTGRYRTALDRNLPGGRYVARADVAACLLRVLDQPETVGHTVGIAD
ncbi:NAD(P)-dependent oxidoreductase [Amycolatopsis sp. cmx-4-68]|uniref:NAD(P)-dependent oxidoreductase n=1 Tax=Amycolatopsis sp. cmx-4-68 TaxID=2790938 RepID=UPI00397DE604